MSSWLTTLSDLEARGVPAVLITVADVDGSAPREPASSTASSSATRG